MDRLLFYIHFGCVCNVFNWMVIHKSRPRLFAHTLVADSDGKKEGCQTAIVSIQMRLNVIQLIYLCVCVCDIQREKGGKHCNCLLFLGLRVISVRFSARIHFMSFFFVKQRKERKTSRFFFCSSFAISFVRLLRQNRKSAYFVQTEKVIGDRTYHSIEIINTFHSKTDAKLLWGLICFHLNWTAFICTFFFPTDALKLQYKTDIS